MSNASTPDVTDVLGASGACPEIKLGNETWVIGWPTQAAKTRLRKLLIGIAEENLIESSADLSPAVFKQTFKDFSESVRGGEYKTWGAGWLAAYNTPRGQLMFLLSLIQENHPTATEADAVRLFREKGEEITLALLCVAPPFFSLLIDDMESLRMAPAEEVQRFKLQMVGQAMNAIRKKIAEFTPPEFAPPSTPSTPTEEK
jgi:hypothetical protein